MAPYEVDSFGILEPPEPEPHPDTTANTDETAPRQPGISASGNGTVSVRGGIDQSHDKLEVRSDKTFVMMSEAVADAAEWLAQARVLERSERGLQDREALQRLAERYVPPPGLLGEAPKGEPETAFQILQKRRVLLIGAEGRDCGQLAAGRRLGFELQNKYQELIVREELIDPGFRLQADALLVEHEPATVLVDLRGSGGDDLLAVRRGLVEFTNQLQHYRSYLILIIPHAQVRSFDEHFPGRVHKLLKPSSVEVLARHLTEMDVHALVQETGAADRLERLWPPKVKELAEAVADRTSNGESQQQALQSVLENELHSWTAGLRQEIREKQEAGDSEWLALLLAAAVLEGASPKHVVDASDQMLAYNELQPERPVPLLRLSPFARLSHLEHERFNKETRLFQPRGFGTQVLRHFWHEHPDLHETMLDWIGELPRMIRDLTRDELERIADRAAELATEGGAGVATALADNWARTRAGEESKGTQTSNHWSDRYRRSIAVRLLTTTATDSGLGKDVRQKLWNWSRDSNADLQLLTAEVCGGLGQSFPRIALTRLKHLASSENDLVRTSVLTAAQQIGTDLGASRFLRYLSEWFDGAPPTRLHLLSEAVSTVLAEQSEAIEADAAASFWNQALDTMPPPDLRLLVESWLRTVSAMPPDQRDSMVEPLVAATKSESVRIAQVQSASRFGRTFLDLSHLGDDPVTEAVHQLWTRLDEVDPIWQ